mmetsp:Transcript_23944/g.68811  ORF Transcript_23944/g.68811 Transcript_23944/m.68811 type:complete len:118 (+) Transcript_23944:1316-1669(+)
MSRSRTPPTLPPLVIMPVVAVLGFLLFNLPFCSPDRQQSTTFNNSPEKDPIIAHATKKNSTDGKYLPPFRSCIAAMTTGNKLNPKFCTAIIVPKAVPTRFERTVSGTDGQITAAYKL